ncbi:hypothetical protein FFZ99_18135 [Leptospira interrogans]|uniref:Uncharacterized protein n=2 Tax=Leptospira interrogans TaxID=173 RepID=A0AAP9WA71_LEPIR|nr:conserved hypothetical protein [Leptospira interrogans serovar Copenhageni str. Fiocruz L1-130]ARB97269.1 hypothetical protein A6J42_19065 [Leptospira interrogans serovar Copenhageni]ASV07453.1 hypothetical protein B2G47_18575 [Leptospira interrogans serovar Canicola]KGE27249.1 hypothetical protein IQ65_07880 [Leptospira interrogans serovar Lai]OQM27679.1 hypothetical protein DV38_18315 [Leptospira interrogans]OQM33213.1 hypothetical protein DV30_02805 [Leptospira interrogans serovar Canico
MICESSHIILQIDLSFVVVPTFKKSICRVQIPTFKIVSFLRRTHVKQAFEIKIQIYVRVPTNH